MNREFKLPDVGEGLTEADIVSWKVKPGDTVTVNQIILEIETAKAVVELPSPWDGTVTSVLVEEGQTVDVGIPIIVIDDGAPPAEQPQTAGQPNAPQESEKRTPVLVGYGVKPGSTRRRARKGATRTGGGTGPSSYPKTPSVPPAVAPPTPPSAAVPAPAPAPDTVSPAPAAPRPAKALAKPPVRKLARDRGVDLAAITGTGPEGSVTRDDVRKAVALSGAASRGTETGATGRSAIAVPGGRPPGAPRGTPDGTNRHFIGHADRGAIGPEAREERIPVRGVRKHTAAAMVGSAFTAPHVTEFLQVDVTETMAAVRRIRDLPEFADLKVSPLLLVARALLTAVRRHPMVNSSWDEAAQEIVVKHYVNLGIAVASDRGLLVPNIKDAGALSLAELAGALGDLAATARAGKASPADLSGGTITITNVGVFGVDAGTPILSPGEAAILAFGQVRDLPWVVDGQLAVRKVTTLSLSFDHRIVDGELGSAVLRDVGAMLEDPLRMLTWA
ncbi:MAG TPA: dihydrolipoamide acetyltransferase family protein [Trebonia sp.]